VLGPKGGQPKPSDLCPILKDTTDLQPRAAGGP
jgi:hypothetical protein